MAEQARPPSDHHFSHPASIHPNTFYNDPDRQNQKQPEKHFLGCFWASLKQAKVAE